MLACCKKADLANFETYKKLLYSDHCNDMVEDHEIADVTQGLLDYSNNLDLKIIGDAADLDTLNQRLIGQH